MIEVKIQDREAQDKIEYIRRADLKCAIMNSALGPHLKPGSKFPYTLYNFIDKEYIPHPPAHEYTPEEQAKRVSEAGRALAQKCELHKRR